jgi:VWFA-related protein
MLRPMLYTKNRWRFARVVLSFIVLGAGVPGLLLTCWPTVSKQEQKQGTRDDSSIRVKVNVVNTPVVVRNAKGELALDLTEKSFRVFDNGIEQTIEGFEMGGAPLSLAIVLEDSSRIEALLPEVRRTGSLFAQAVLGENGDAAVIGYDDEVHRLLEPTNDHDVIASTVAGMESGMSGAHLCSALSEAEDVLRSVPASHRRVIVTVGEAVDTGSYEGLGHVLDDAQLADITFYFVGLSTTLAKARGPEEQAAPLAATPPGTVSLPPIPGTAYGPTAEQLRNGNIDLLALASGMIDSTKAVQEHSLAIATAATGGLYLFTFRGKSIETALDEIGGELHAQYTISYHPTGADQVGYHDIRVEVVDHPGLTVRTRPGYYLSLDRPLSSDKSPANP